VSVRQGESLLWAEDHVGGIRRDPSQEQPACARAQHPLHCLGNDDQVLLDNEPVFLDDQVPPVSCLFTRCLVVIHF